MLPYCTHGCTKMKWVSTYQSFICGSSTNWRRKSCNASLRSSKNPGSNLFNFHLRELGKISRTVLIFRFIPARWNRAMSLSRNSTNWLNLLILSCVLPSWVNVLILKMHKFIHEIEQKNLRFPLNLFMLEFVSHVSVFHKISYR